MDQPKINYEFPYFPDQTAPKGNLINDSACHACWYYYLLAHKMWAKVGDQFGVLEGNPWLTKHYEQLAKSVAIMYGLNDPSEFMKYWPLIAMECSRLEMHQPVPEYMKPLRLKMVN
jgi:hypothetical protein